MSMQVQIKRFTGVLYNNLTTMPHIWFDALRCKIKGISSKSIVIIYNILIKLYGIRQECNYRKTFVLNNVIVLVVLKIIHTFAL